MKTTVTLAVAILLASGTAWAQDFQVGARAKGMGGSYTAFEDDPTSIWMNPAGIATQSVQLGIAYQAYTQYEFDFERTDSLGDPETGLINPQILPSFLGVVYQLGTPEQPFAFGFAYVRPVQLTMTYDDTPGDGIKVASDIADQQFSRLRFGFAYDFRLRAPGEAGFLPHIAIGAGLDIAYTVYQLNSGTPDTGTAWGGGVGILIGLYDNTESFKIAVGAALQSQAVFNWQRDTTDNPSWDWPAMWSAGVTIYLLSGMPLRMTVDVQAVDWENAAEGSGQPGLDPFRSVMNISFGMEYRMKLREDGSLLLYPRLGFRKVEAPWDDEDRLPAFGLPQLSIDTKAAEFSIITFGFGLYWTTADGKSRGVDLGVEFGGDSPTFAFGYNHEF